MARQGNRTKLPAKEKAFDIRQSTANCGFVVYYCGEQIKMRQSAYGSFKKLLQAAIAMQKSDPNFDWSYYDTLPE